MKKQAALVFFWLWVILILAVLCLSRLMPAFLSEPVTLLVLLSAVWGLVWALVNRSLVSHPHERFGAANMVTSVRAALTLVLASSVFTIQTLHRSDDALMFWLLSAIAVFALMLDGLDGMLARGSGLSSSFGARYDMETDAMLGLIITLLVWRSGELGSWVLGLGLLRYVFVLASLFVPALRAELFSSFRRKLVCVIQIAVLGVLLTPLVEPPLSTALAAFALLLLLASFVRDVWWLMKNAKPEIEKGKIKQT